MCHLSHSSLTVCHHRQLLAKASFTQQPGHTHSEITSGLFRYVKCIKVYA